MRTTITIDDDVAERLQVEMRLRQTTNFKETVNDVLRRGLLAREELQSQTPFRVRGRKLGTRKGIQYDNISDLLDQLEGVDRR